MDRPFCYFNSSSLTNVLIREESKWVSLDEARMQVKPTSELEAKLKKVFLSEVKDC